MGGRGGGEPVFSSGEVFSGLSLVIFFLFWPLDSSGLCYRIRFESIKKILQYYLRCFKKASRIDEYMTN